MVIWLLISAGIIILLLSGLSFLFILIFFKLIPPHWRKDIQWMMVEVMAAMSMLLASKLVTITILMFTEIIFAFVINPIPPHICGGPSNFQGTNCAAEQAWFQENKIAAERYNVWVMTPPWLRPPCDSVAPHVCEVIKNGQILGAWPQYIIQITTVLLSGLSCGLVTYWVFKGEGLPTWIKP